MKRALEQRTKVFAVKVIGFVRTFPPSRAADVIAYQLLKAATAVGANYREANRAESARDFIHKIAIVEKEIAECRYWLELCNDTSIGRPEEGISLLSEAGELLAIFSAANRTSKNRYADSGKFR